MKKPLHAVRNAHSLSVYRVKVHRGQEYWKGIGGISGPIDAQMEYVDSLRRNTGRDVLIHAAIPDGVQTL